MTHLVGQSAFNRGKSCLIAVPFPIGCGKLRSEYITRVSFFHQTEGGEPGCVAARLTVIAIDSGRGERGTKGVSFELCFLQCVALTLKS